MNRICVKNLVIAILVLISPAFAQSTKSVITSIKAEQTSSNTITVSWDLPQDKESVGNFLVYRGTRPFTNYAQVENAEPVAVLNSDETSFTDTVKTTLEYYYAIISSIAVTKSSSSGLYYDQQTDTQGQYNPEAPVVKNILPGVNATVAGAGIRAVKKNTGKGTIQKVQTAKKTYGEGDLRETPLPYIDVLDEKPVHEPTISKESKEKAKTLIKGTSTYKREPLSIHVFEEDLVSPAGGDEYLLFDILKTYFIRKKYSESVTALRKFLAQNRNKEVANRASFYLGESYYYTGNFPNALTRFLALEEFYPELCRQWIDSTLDQF